MELGTIIRKHRQSRGWTQGDLASAAGVSRTTIVAIEKGYWTPKPETYEAVAEAMGLTCEELTIPPDKRMSNQELLNNIIHMMNEYRARMSKEREARR